jgi:hypothetical protein
VPKNGFGKHVSVRNIVGNQRRRNLVDGEVPEPSDNVLPPLSGPVPATRTETAPAAAATSSSSASVNAGVNARDHVADDAGQWTQVKMEEFTPEPHAIRCLTKTKNVAETATKGSAKVPTKVKVKKEIVSDPDEIMPEDSASRISVQSVGSILREQAMMADYNTIKEALAAQATEADTRRQAAERDQETRSKAVTLLAEENAKRLRLMDERMEMLLEQGVQLKRATAEKGESRGR